LLLKTQSMLVTGAARGVGEAIALSAAREGTQVTAVDINADGLKALREKARLEGFDIQVVTADVSEAKGNEVAVKAAEERFGPLTAFIANAAVIRFATPLATVESDWDAIQSTNLKGVYLGVQAAVPSLRRSSGGSIVLIASILGIVGDPLLSAYGAAKGALRALCRSLAVAHAAEQIRCNTVCPGDVETDMMRAQLALDKSPEEARAAMLSHYPLGRLASPQDVANAVLFLASPKASYITGTDLVIDGGLLARCY
jgi:NAD(P)-dependent dehydrogenase (short-subunit alcohol dehydrogenase family)